MNFRTKIAVQLGLVCAALSTAGARAAEISFRRQVIDADSQFTAAAVFDVNHDGKLDIVCGSHWYEASTWKKHFVREVEALGNPPRYDGFAHLPMDVNGDGWIDIITVNYRSRSIKWIEHPGASLGPWTAHTIDEPGPAETGRLVDVDGNGQLDILPNTVQSAGWWELIREQKDGKQSPHWLRHNLPRDVAGHGLGFGDIDGDGRGDLIGPRGWLQSPPKPREDRWQWHAEFDLDSASIPILIVDADGDGDNDIVWSRAHNFGIYWLEQDRGEGEKRRWTKHTIDTAWAGAHAPLWADLDGDGQNELIAGKRYLAHEGRDPGEYDPLVSYRYQFDRATRTWQRSPISLADGVGFGLDPKAIDLDTDGDLDLVCSDRCGLFVLENLRISQKKESELPTQVATPKYNDRKNLLVVRDVAGNERQVKTPFDWGLRRTHILAAMQEVLGPLPDSSRRTPLDMKVEHEFDDPKYTIKSITFTSEPGHRERAALCIPKNLTSKAPAVLCRELRFPHMGNLASRGYVCLNITDYPQSDRVNSKVLKRDQGRYDTLAMKAIWNNIRAIDLLESLPETDIDRIGCIGDFSGGRSFVLTAAFDQRLAATVSICALSTFEGYQIRGYLADEFQLPLDPASYLQRIRSMPFDFHEVVAAIVPRNLLVVAQADDKFLNPAGTKEVLETASAVYKFRGAESKLKAMYPEDESQVRAAQDQIYEWLDGILKRTR